MHRSHRHLGRLRQGGRKGTPGKGELVAYDLATGGEKWKWSGDGPGYGSPVVATIQGIKQVVEQTDENLIGVGLEDGKLLWKTPLKVGRYQTGTPIVTGNEVICVGTAFTIEKSGDKLTAKQRWKEPRTRDLQHAGAEGRRALWPRRRGGQGRRGWRRGQGKGGFGMRTTKLFAQDAKTGAELWTDKAPRGECGAILDAGAA